MYGGYYSFNILLFLKTPSGTANGTVVIKKNGTTDILTTGVVSFPAGILSLSCIEQVSIGDFFEVYLTNTSTAHAIYVDFGTSFSVQRIQA